LSNQTFLSEIYIYPIKSLSGIKLLSSEFAQRGLKYDRRLMLVDENNKFISQREFPKMSLIKTEISDKNLICRIDSFNDLEIPLEISGDKLVKVNVWRSFCDSYEYDNDTNNWFSDFLNKKVRLVYMPNSTKREVNTYYSIKNNIVSFADGYPFLVIGQESLDNLNSKLSDKIDINRFRPNLVIKGFKPHFEDENKIINIGENTFFIVKPCERCLITTINQEKGISTSKEPLKTLSEYRKINGKVIFGQNLIAKNEHGFLKVGDKVSF